MQNLLRYIRAFIRALMLTVRGQKPPSLEAEEQYTDLLAWCREIVARVDATNAAAMDAIGTNPQLIKMHIEGRDVTLKHTLDVLRYHAAREYPHLIRSRTPHAILAIQALNVNDRFLVVRLSEYEGLADRVKSALDTLADHLTQIPKL
jgi:hypothetical protein